MTLSDLEGHLLTLTVLNLHDSHTLENIASVNYYES